MHYEVIVIGAGIGGLTTAALLSARGVDVCVFERQSEVGGCVANFSHLGYTFEPTFGMYSGWQEDGFWERVFSELQVSAPAVTRLSPNYIVRLPDGRDVSVSSSGDALGEAVRTAFPECAAAAVSFLYEIKKGPVDKDILAELLAKTSREFRFFIEAQLQTFGQCTTDVGSPDRIAAAMRVATGELWSIDGGAQVLADRLADSLKASGGSLRLNATVLRLAYDDHGRPIGVDLLSGERVTATRAIVSNLTIWDTYGKLIGPGRTPKEFAMDLKKLSSWGTYQIFLGLDQTAAAALPGARVLLVHGSNVDGYDPEQQQLMLNLLPDAGFAPEGKRGLTATAFAEPADWFSFHEDHTWHESKDQTTLESWWTRLHEALPDLGDGIEVIETSTPQTTYDSTRRRLGMVGAPCDSPGAPIVRSPFSNLFLVGDTVSTGLGVEGAGWSALAAADKILK